jgi:hypothetical protein
MWVTHLRSAAVTVITGEQQLVEITVSMDPLYLSIRLESGLHQGEKARPTPLQITIRLVLYLQETNLIFRWIWNHQQRR